MALHRKRAQLAERQWWDYVRFVRRRWYEEERKQLRDRYGCPRGVLDSLLILVIFLLTSNSRLPEPLPLYSASEIPALFGSPNKETEDALRGLQYARECDLRTPQEIEWKKAELSAAIRRAKADYDKSALDDALEERRKLQDLQMSIFAMQYAAERRTTRRGDERAR